MAAREPIGCKLVIDNSPIEQVMTFDYLGCKFSRKGNLTNDAKRNINKVAVISGVWKSRTISIECKARIYKACVRPVTTYAAEVRADTGRDQTIDASLGNENS